MAISSNITELDTFATALQRRRRSLMLQGGEGQVVVQDGGVAAHSLLDGERKRAAHIGQALRIPQRSTATAAVAEGPRWFRDAQTGGKLERPLGRSDRLREGGIDRA